MRLTLFFMFSLLFVFCLYQAEAVDVTIPDGNLEAALRDALGKPTGPITDTDLATLTIFDADYEDIADLTGLNWCVNLTSLDVSDNFISDISPLAALTNLTWLDLNDNPLSDISPLAGLTNLTWLDLNDNPLSDISPLAGLTNLTWLDLNDNLLSDISPLAGLTNLTWLNLNYNPLSDISPLAGLTNLTWLDLNENPIFDISSLAGLTNLVYLSLEEIYATDISSIATLTNLTTLHLRGLFTDISVVSNLTSLTIIDLGGPFTDISVVSWSSLPDLVWLELHGEFTDISIVSNLTDLTRLELWGNFTNISAVENLTDLTQLELGGNFTDISAVADLTKLTWLSLPDNNISNISALANLTALIELDLEENLISDISVLQNLTNLEQLELEENNIRDISPLANNTGFGENDDIRLDENPLNDDALLIHIPALEGRGVDVDYDDDHDEYPPSVEELTVTLGTVERQIKLEWENPDEQVTGYIVRYGTEDVDEDTWGTSQDVAGEPVPGPPGGVETMYVTVPLSGVVYHFGVRTEDADSDRSSLEDIESEDIRSSVYLYEGWNNIAFIADTVMPVEDVIDSISDQYVSMWRYKSDTGEWLMNLTGDVAIFTNMTDVNPGYGYWLNVNAGCLWDYGEGTLASPAKSDPRPPFVLYGKTYSQDTTDTSQVLQQGNVLLKIGTDEVDRYALGSNAAYSDYYVIEIPVDGRFREGDSAQLFVNGMSDEKSPVTIGGIGTLERHDIYYTDRPRISKLLQNYPNPFNPETWVPYQLRKGSNVTIRIYSVSGELVRDLSLGSKDTGVYFSKERAAYWDGRNQAGEEVASGIYFYSIQAGEFMATKKMIIAR